MECDIFERVDQHEGGEGAGRDWVRSTAGVMMIDMH